MSRLFISHSGKNDDWAIALKDWLVREGWTGPDDIFLDLDPERGIAAGQRWVHTLEDAATRCEAVLFLVSDDWLASKWCADEYQLANRLNKKLFALLTDDIALERLPGGLAAQWQIVRLKGEPAERFLTVHPLTQRQSPVHIAQAGLKSLKRGLDKAGIAAETFDLRPDQNGPFGWRAPYRGLEALEPEDAAVFFGRNADIVRGIDMLRGLATRKPPRLVVILGASGAGKSSFLRAGLWPRLLRDDGQWLPLRPIRASRGGAVEGSEGLLAAIEDVHRRFGLPATRAGLRDRLAAPDSFVALLHDLRLAAARRALIAEPPFPLPVLCLDQGEEVFAAGATPETERFLALARAAIDRDAALLLVTIRSDSYAAMQAAKPLAGIDQVPLSLGPVPHGEIAHVIREPAEILRRKVGPGAPLFDAAVIAQLQNEVEGETDSLPLLAFVLQRLVREHQGLQSIGMAELEQTGGVAAAIESAADAALEDAGVGRERAAQRDALRRLFIPRLARIDRDSKAPQRRVARQSDVPGELSALARALTERRLLVVKAAAQVENATAANTATLEVAHEALLRRWPTLAELLAEDRDALLLLDGVLSAAADWDRAEPERKLDFLAHRGSRLADAQTLAARGPDWMREIAPAQDYLAACEARELRERSHRDRLQRRVLYATAAGLLVAIVLGTLATLQWRQADRSRTEAEHQRVLAETAANAAKDQRNRALLNDSRRLEERAVKALDDRRPVQAALLALEGLPGLTPQEERPYLPGLEATLYQAGAEFRELPALGKSIDIGSDRFAAADASNNVGIYDWETGERLVAMIGHSGAVTDLSFSQGMLATGSEDKTARVWDAASGRVLAVLQLGAPAVRVAFLGNGILMTTCSDGTAKLWSIGDWKQLFAVSGHSGNVESLVANNDVHRAFSYGADMTARLWDTTSGRQLAVVSVPSAAAGAQEKRTKPQIYGYFNKSGSLALIQRRTTGDVSDAVILDTATGSEIAHFDNASAGFAGDGKLVWVVRYDPRHFSLWDAAAKRMLVEEDADWELQSSYFLLWSKTSNTADLIDAATGKRIALLSAQAPITGVRPLPKSGRIFTAAADGTADFWDSGDGHLVRHVPDAGAIKFTNGLDDDRRLLVEGGNDTYSLWDTSDGNRLLSLPQQEYSPTIIGGNRIAAAVDGSPQVWDAETGTALPKPKLQGEGASKFDLLHSGFTADGQRAATIVAPKKIRVWDVRTGKKVEDIETPTEIFSVGMTFSPDGSKLLTERRVVGSHSGPKEIWAADSGKSLGSIPVTEATPGFSRHGNLLMLRESFPGTFITRRTRLWRTDTTSPMTSLWLGGPGTVQSVQFVPGTDRLLVVRKSSQPFPFRAEVYDLNAGKELPQLTGPTGNFDLPARGVSDDGRHAAARSDDDTLRIWDLATGKVLATVPNVVGARPSHDMLLVNRKGDHTEMWSIAAAKMLYAVPDIPGGFAYWAFSPDARYFATWSEKGDTRIWEAASGRQIALLPEASYPVFSLDGAHAFVRVEAKRSAVLVESATGRTLTEFPTWHNFIFSRNGRRAVVTEGQHTNTARVIDTATGETRASLAVDNQATDKVQLSDDGKMILLRFKDGTSQLFDGRTGNPIALPEQGGKPADEYRLSPDGRRVVIVHGAAADLYDIDGKSAVPLKAHKDKITEVDFDRSGRLLLTASKDGEILLFDISAAKTLDLSHGAAEPLRFAVLSGNGRWVLAQSENGTLRLFDTESGKLLQSATFDISENAFARLYEDQGLLVAMVNEKFEPGANVIRVIDESGNQVGAMALANRIVALGVNSDHDRMLAADYANTFSLWDLLQSKQIAQTKGAVGEISFAFSADHKRMAAVGSGYNKWQLRLWDEAGKTALVSEDVTLAKTRNISAGFAADSKVLWALITRFDDLPVELHLFDAASGKALADPDLAWTARHEALVSPRRDRILFRASQRGNAVLWDIAGSKQIAVIPDVGSDSNPTFSPDERWIATASPDHTVKLWDVQTGALQATFSGPTAQIHTIAISDDGRYLAAGSSDGMARIWNIATGATVYTLEPSAASSAGSGHATVQQVLFSRDGKRLATRTDRLINVWEMSSGEQIAALPLSNNSPSTSFSPDGRLLLRGTDYANASVLLNRVFPQVRETVSAARKAVPRCLTPAERKASFLDPEPPAWCIEMAKPPYDSAEWRSWLAQKKAAREVQMPSIQ